MYREGGGGGGGHRSYADTGFCAMHKRKRNRGDLMSWEGHQGRMRCRPHKECRGRQERDRRDHGHMVVCRAHGRRRNPAQMREIRPGVYECLPTALCRPQAGGRFSPYGHRDRRDWRGGDGRGGGHRDQYQNAGRDRHDLANAAAWAPSGAGVARVGGGRRAPRVTMSLAARTVWCARHGKRIERTQCEMLQDCCSVCKDNSTCLSTPLEPASTLLGKQCTELLCSQHNTLRSAGFLELTEDKSGYQCVPGHPCRGVTIPIHKDSGASAWPGEDGGMILEEGQQQLGEYASGMYNAYAQQPSARDAVSSFFA